MTVFLFDIKVRIGISLIGSKAIDIMKTILATGSVGQWRQADGPQGYFSPIAVRKRERERISKSLLTFEKQLE